LYRRFKPYVGKMGFPALEKLHNKHMNSFQSLVGVYGFSRAFQFTAVRTDMSFNP